ncbi:MAG: hypothetical protein HUK01_03290 [Bacteroidaceae bacterium]|nr:hypothetical protein [Bacteroidaceae bacterium]
MTSEMRFQVECLTTELTALLMQEYGWDMRHALDALYASDTFRLVCDPATGLYYEAPLYVFDYLQKELDNTKHTKTIEI